MYGPGPIVQCKHCNQGICWMKTRFGGNHLPFDPEPIAKERDHENRGWIPGAWTVRGRARIVLAPLHHYPATKQARVVNVVLAHQCREYAQHLAAARAGAAA